MVADADLAGAGVADRQVDELHLLGAAGFSMRIVGLVVVGHRVLRSVGQCAIVPEPTMKRLTRAPNLAIATLWADLLGQAGVAATVQRA